MSRFCVALLAACFRAQAEEPLPALGADSSDVTVSGVSSGAYMAVQLHVAHSRIVKGVGAIAGGLYYCAQGSLWKAYINCMTPGGWTPLPSMGFLGSEAEALAKAGRIDATGNLAGARVWLFTGTQDRTVHPDVIRALRRFYDSFAGKTVLVADKPAGHGMVTKNAGNACAVTASPYINDCDYDAAGELLKHLLGALEPPAPKPAGRLLRFDQRPFGGASISMDDAGYVFVPKSCETARCRVHVAFHGCRQGASFIGDRFAREAGYNRWADGNRLIVLYPQAAARYAWWSFNPRGCWDWWGYTGANYHTREGAQLRAVKAMLERLSAPRQ